MYIRHRNRRLRVSEISSNTDQNDASFLMNDAVTGVEANIAQAKSLYRSLAGRLDTVQDFLIKLGIKPGMHLWEIKNFPQNNVMTKIGHIFTNVF